MNRRQFVKAALLGLVGAFLPRFPTLQHGGYVKVTVTDPDGRACIYRRPLHVIHGNGDVWRIDNWGSANPIHKKVSTGWFFEERGA